MAGSRSEKPGIRDVAEAAGVSPTTVSHAMSGKGRISEQTKERVKRAASELGYKPNPNAQGLAKGRRGLIALVVGGNPDRDRHTIERLPDFMYLANIAVAASNHAVRRGLGLLLSPDVEDTDALLDLGTGAVLLVGPIEGDPVAAEFHDRGIPVVTVGRIPGASREENPYWADNDHGEAMRTCLEHFREQGARNIALISGPPDASYAIDSLEAYRGWCEASGEEASVITIEGDPFTNSARDPIQSSLESAGRPDAILCLLHPLARMAKVTALEMGIDVPADLLVATISDDRLLNANSRDLPAITGTDLNPATLAREAIDIAECLMSGEEPDNPRRIVPTTLIPRASSIRD